MMKVPEITNADMAFGNIKHMPKYGSLPAEFQDWHNNDFCRAISSWFYSGAKTFKNGIQIKDETFTAKEGVSANAALAAIRSVLASWEPKHEHKIAACGFMLNEWFDKS